MFNDVYETYNKLKETLVLKKQAIIKKNLENINILDEKCIVLCEKLKKFNLKEISVDFTTEEKEKLKNLAYEIKKIQNSNEILTKHSIGVINNILSGILNIARKGTSSYNSKGKNTQISETLDISSITEEA